MADDFLKRSEVRDVGHSSHNILPLANQPMGESHVGISFSNHAWRVYLIPLYVDCRQDKGWHERQRA